MTRAEVVDRVRRLCLDLPESSERLSHGSPAFFRRRRQFATVVDNHHGDGRFAIWCAAPPLSQAMFVESDPDRYFVPPYVGHRGWLGVRLDRRLEWPQLEAILKEAHTAAG